MTAIGPRGGEHSNRDQMLMRAVWRTKAWKARVAELLVSTSRCEWCNGKSRVINHRRQGYYEGYELCRRDEIDVICQPCHKHFTETGRKRQRLYDDCSSCEAPIYLGRKVCFQCGSKTIISKSKRSPAEQARLIGILERCPEVRVGDLWKSVWAWGDVEVTVLGFATQDLPWPLVKTDKGEVGLPAFAFATRVTEGDGASYRELEA